MSILVTLAWRDLWLRRLRTLLTIISIMLGVAVILAVRTADRSTFESIKAFFDEAAGKTNVIVENAASSRRALLGFSPDVVQQVQAMAGVAQAVPRLTDQTVYQGKRGPVGLAVQGVDPAVDNQVRIYSPVEGTFLSPTGRGYTVVLVEDFAQREGIRVGQDIQLLSPSGLETFRVVGIVARKNAGVMNGGQVVFVPLRVGQDVFNRGRKIDAVDVVAEPTIGQSAILLQQFKERLQAALGENYTVMYPATKGSSATEALSSIQYGLGLFGLFALFASALLINSTFTMGLAEHIREIGTLRTLGISRMQIAGQLLGGALFLSLIGSALGLVLGFVLAVPLLQVFGALTGYELGTLAPSVTDVVLSFLMGVAVTIVSALWTVIQACRLSPLEAVRVRGQEPEGVLVQRSWMIGLILLAIWGASFFIPWLTSAPMFLVFFAGATFLLPGVVHQFGKWARNPIARVYGYEGSVGITNLERSRWRTSTTVAVLMVGIAMGISIGAVSDSLMNGIQSWLDSAMSADLFVNSYKAMNPVWGRRLASIEDVAIVSPMRTLDAKAEDPRNPGRRFTVRVQAVDPSTQEQIGAPIYASGQGQPAELWATFARGSSLFVSTQIAEEHNLRQGDALRLQTAHGVQEFSVAAVIVDLNDMRGTVMMTWNDLTRFFGLTDVDVYLVKLRSGADPDAVRQEIDTRYGRAGQLTVRSNAQAKQSAIQNVNTIMLAFNAVVWIAFIIAAFGIVNTLTMNVIERTREIGLLRAVGMTRFQVSKMILAEALAMGLVSGVFGVAFGGVFSRVVVWWMDSGMGFRLNYVLPVLALGTSCVLALVLSQLAALLPARRSLGLSVLEALRYE